MSVLGQAIRTARKRRRWSQPRLAEEASKLQGCPGVSVRQVVDLERGRTTLRLEDDGEPARWVIPVLGVDPAVVLRSLGVA